MFKKIWAYLTGRIVCKKCGKYVKYMLDYDKWDNCECGYNPNYDK